MKIVVYTGKEPTLHTDAGILQPGPNEIQDDRLADRLLEAGKYTGDFVPLDARVAEPGAKRGRRDEEAAMTGEKE